MATSHRLVKLTNEVVVLVPEYDMTTALIKGVQNAGTGQISVDSVTYRKTPFGTGLLLITATVTRRGASSADLRTYVRRVLEQNGHSAPAERVLTPARPRTSRVSD